MSTIAEVNILKAQLDEAAAALNAARQEEKTFDNQAIEFNRQSVFHAQNGNFTDSQIAAARRDEAVSKQKAAKDKINAAEARFKTANDAYSKALSTLPPEEKTVYVKQEQAKNSAASTQNTIAFIQGTTKYLIYGAIALVLIVGAVILFRKKYSA